MAPEQMNAKTVGPKADQYSFAMIVYELLSGCLPWEESTTGVMISVVKMTDALKSLHERSALTKSYSDIVMRGLSLKPEDRHHSCVALIEELQKLSLTPDKADEMPPYSERDPDNESEDASEPSEELKQSTARSVAEIPPPAVEEKKELPNRDSTSATNEKLYSEARSDSEAQEPKPKETLGSPKPKPLPKRDSEYHESPARPKEVSTAKKGSGIILKLILIQIYMR